MVFWNEIDLSCVDFVPYGKDRVKFRYKDGPLRFQVPRGLCQWGISAYKAFQVELGSNTEFLAWWRDLEGLLCTAEPFNSNLKLGSLRLKIDDATYVFDAESKQTNPEIREGLFRNQELSCLVDIESTYFFNGTWGLICRAVQVKTYGGGDSESEAPRESFSLKGFAFLPTDA